MSSNVHGNAPERVNETATNPRIFRRSARRGDTGGRAYRLARELDSLLDSSHWPNRRARTASTLCRLLSIEDMQSAIDALEMGEEIILDL